MMKTLAVLLLGPLAATPAFADCSSFKWSVARELEAFASPQKISSVSGSADLGKGYDVALTPDLALPVKPERDPKAGTSAAVLELPKIDAGVYQVTLSEEAWVDVAQSGTIVKSSDFSGKKDCPGVRKSVRFTLKAGAATVEISNVAGAAIKVAVEPAN